MFFLSRGAMPVSRASDRSPRVTLMDVPAMGLRSAETHRCGRMKMTDPLLSGQGSLPYAVRWRARAKALPSQLVSIACSREVGSDRIAEGEGDPLCVAERRGHSRALLPGGLRHYGW